jgi:hypothetical protein
MDRLMVKGTHFKNLPFFDDEDKANRLAAKTEKKVAIKESQ